MAKGGTGLGLRKTAVNGSKNSLRGQDKKRRLLESAKGSKDMRSGEKTGNSKSAASWSRVSECRARSNGRDIGLRRPQMRRGLTSRPLTQDSNRPTGPHRPQANTGHNRPQQATATKLTSHSAAGTRPQLTSQSVTESRPEQPSCPSPNHSEIPS